MTACSCGGIHPDATGSATTSAGLNVTYLGAATPPLAARFPVPDYPPIEWFLERPDWLTPGTKLTVDDAGRVAGYFFEHGQCLVHDHGACPRPSPTGYAAFHQNELVVEDGQTIRVGVIGNTHGHASPYAPVSVAQEHYADPTCALIACVAYDDDHGGYILGTMLPGTTGEDVALVRRSALSGDWRPMPPSWWQAHGVTAAVVTDVEGYDCIGPTLVTRPGLPLVQMFDGSVDAGRAAAILGGCGGIQLDSEVQAMTTPMRRTIIEEPMPVGPYPAPAVTAADVPPGEAEPPADEAADWQAAFEELAGIVMALDERLAAVEEAVSAMVGSQIAALEAAALPLPGETITEPVTA